MRNSLVLATLLLALLACAENKRITKESERYSLLASEPTPADWTPGTVWKFVTTDGHGNETFRTFRVSGSTAESCIAGEWKALELLEGDTGALAGKPFKAAALVEGRNLWVNLASNWCDLNMDIKGELQGATFIGRHTSGGLRGGILSTKGVPPALPGWQ